MTVHSTVVFLQNHGRSPIGTWEKGKHVARVKDDVLCGQVTSLAIVDRVMQEGEVFRTQADRHPSAAPPMLLSSTATRRRVVVTQEDPVLETPQSHATWAPRIVVADDNIDMGGLIGLLLRSRGFDVAVLPNGEAALDAILSDGADGLVCDFHMDGLNGLMLCRVLRSLRASMMLPIVVFTGADRNDGCLLPLRQMNDVRILHKPLGFGDIAPVLMEMIPT